MRSGGLRFCAPVRPSATNGWTGMTETTVTTDSDNDKGEVAPGDQLLWGAAEPLRRMLGILHEHLGV